MLATTTVCKFGMLKSGRRWMRNETCVCSKNAEAVREGDVAVNVHSVFGRSLWGLGLLRKPFFVLNWSGLHWASSSVRCPTAGCTMDRERVRGCLHAYPELRLSILCHRFVDRYSTMKHPCVDCQWNGVLWGDSISTPLRLEHPHFHMLNGLRLTNRSNPSCITEMMDARPCQSESVPRWNCLIVIIKYDDVGPPS